MSDVHFMPFPYSLRCPFGLGGDEGAKASIRYIERLLNDDEAGIMKPAAIIVEPYKVREVLSLRQHSGCANCAAFVMSTASC